MTGTQGMTVREPESLTLSEQNQSQDSFQVEELQEGAEMYDGIVVDFENSGFKVDKIERLENNRLKKKYITERDQLLEERKDNPDFKLNEKFLYHGTSVKKDVICEEGLDYRMAKQGCFGRGIYFSDYPRKCMKYAEKGGCTESIILLMRVILGEAKEYPKGQKDRTLVREPEKTQPYVGNRFYDSVKGCPVNHSEFVVYESRRAIVECIVTYSKIQDTSNPTQTAEAANPVIEDSDTSSDDDEPSDEWKRKQEILASLQRNDNDQDNSSSSDDELANEAERDGQNVWQDTTPDSPLSQMMQTFSRKTGENNKYTIEAYLNMVDLDLDRAVSLYQETVAKEGEWTKEDHEAPEKLISEQARTIPLHPEKLANMSDEDREAAIQSLVDSLLEAMGRDLKDEEDRKLAKKYLKASDMDYDEAMCMYISTLAARP